MATHTPAAAGAAVADDVARLDAALRAEGTPERAEQEKRYLKSELAHYGVTVPANRRVVLAFLQERRERVGAEFTSGELQALTEALWARGVFELRFAATELLTARAGDLDLEDLDWLEPLLRRSHTWALIDGLAVDVVGPLLERHPQAADAIRDRWIRDDDFWIRRTALLTLLRRLKRGDDDAFARFTALADPLLEEKEFFIRKAIGWCLRDYGKRRPESLAAWLEPRKTRASGLTLREATKHLPDELKAQLLPPRRRSGA